MLELFYRFIKWVLFMNNAALKLSNRGAILELLLTNKARNRSELAAMSRLTKMTVSNIVGELISKEIVQEASSVNKGGQGRPTGSLSLSIKAPKILGIHLGLSSSFVSLLDLMGNVIKKESFVIDCTSHETFLETTYIAIDKIVRESINERILCVSASTDYPLSKDGQSLILLSVGSLPFNQAITKRYGLPVFIESRPICAVLTEQYFGASKESKNAVYIQIDQQIQSAATIDRKPIVNPNGGGIKIEHISIDYNGLSCTCGGRGCLQSYISIDSMEKKLRDITKLKTDFKGFCEIQSKKNDSRIDWALKDMMDKLGFALKSVANIISQDTVIIGGLGTALPDRYLVKLEKYLSTDNVTITVRKEDISEERSALNTACPALMEILSGKLVL